MNSNRIIIPEENEAELAIMSAVLVDPQQYDKVRKLHITGETFLSKKVRTLFNIMESLRLTKGYVPSITEVQRYLHNHPSTELSDQDLEMAMTSYNATIDVEVLGRYVKDADIKRKAQRDFSKIPELFSDPTRDITTTLAWVQARIDECRKTISEITDAESDPIEKYDYDTAKDTEEPRWMFRINGTNTMPLGSITAVTGKAKAGKSNFVMLLLGAIVSHPEMLLSIQLNEKITNVLYVDTEQPHHAINLKFRRMLRTAGYDIHTSLKEVGIKLLSMRDATVKERHDVVIKAWKKYKPQLLIIDGIVDLIFDFNDIPESQKLMQELMDMTKMGTTVVALLHENEGNAKMRGHLGTFLLQKCDDKFNIFKKDGHFEVGYLGRNAEMRKFTFKIDGDVYDTDDRNMADVGIVRDIKNLYLESKTDILPAQTITDYLMKKYHWNQRQAEYRKKKYENGDNPLLIFNKKTKMVKLTEPPV